MEGYYLGAYLKITVKKRMEESPYVWCGTEGHPRKWDSYSDESSYCARCGHVQERMPDVEAYPTHLLYEVLPEEYEDDLAEVRQRDNFGKSVIYAVSNTGDCKSSWTAGNDRPFPTAKEINTMKAALTSYHSNVIDLISKSPLVERVEVCCGLLVDEDF